MNVWYTGTNIYTLTYIILTLHLFTILQIQKFIKDLTEITNDIKRQESAAVPNQQLLAPAQPKPY